MNLKELLDMDRRQLLKSSAGTLALIAIPGFIINALANNEIIKMVKLSEKEWKEKLTPEEFNVLRKEGTERPFTSPLNNEKRKGTFVCKGCDLPLFTSETKFDSGTGWPSFYDAIKGNVGTKLDFVLLIPRTEYHCARCGGHQGHIFKDGPKPTGLRYCNNGVALKFIPEVA